MIKNSDKQITLAAHCDSSDGRAACWPLAPESTQRYQITTLRQRTYAALVNAFLQERLMPTVHEITLTVGFCSNSHTEHYLRWLRHRGFIHRLPKVCRGMRFAEYAGDIPSIGVITAGRLSSPCSIIEDGLLQPTESFYAVRVTDYSLQDEQLCPGDVLFIQPRRGNVQEESMQGRLIVTAHWEGAQRYATLTRWTASTPGDLAGIVINVVRLL